MTSPVKTLRLSLAALMISVVPGVSLANELGVAIDEIERRAQTSAPPEQQYRRAAMFNPRWDTLDVPFAYLSAARPHYAPLRGSGHVVENTFDYDQDGTLELVLHLTDRRACPDLRNCPLIVMKANADRTGWGIALETVAQGIEIGLPEAHKGRDLPSVPLRVRSANGLTEWVLSGEVFRRAIPAQAVPVHPQPLSELDGVKLDAMLSGLSGYVMPEALAVVRGDLGDPDYFWAEIDLNGDGVGETMIGLRDASVCTQHGCPHFIFSQTSDVPFAAIHSYATRFYYHLRSGDRVGVADVYAEASDTVERHFWDASAGRYINEE